MTTAAIYARVSTDEQANNFSLDSQVNYCRDYITRKGYTLACDPFLEDYTGTAMDRPELDKVRSIAGEGKIDRLICLELDRLGRGLVIPFVLESEFKKLGATVEYVQETYEDTPEGALKKGMRATISEYERLKIMERTKRGKLQKVNSGSVIGSSTAKYGYEVVKAGRQTLYCPVSDEAAIVQLIFDWFTVGDETGRKLHMTQIARRLSEMHVPTRFDKVGGKRAKLKRQRHGVWHKKTIMAILRDEIYAGTAYYGRSKSVDQNGKKKRVRTPKSQWVAIPVPAIISREMWQAAQDRIASNRIDPAANSRNNTRSVYLMRGRITCAKCGGVLRYAHSPHGTTHHGFYACRGARRVSALNHEKICSGGYPRDEVDVLIWQGFSEQMKNPDYIQESYRKDQADTSAQNGPILARLEIVNSLLAEKEAEQANLLDQYLKPTLFPRELVEQRAETVQREIVAHKHEKAQLEARIVIPRIDENALAGLLEYSAQFRQGLDNLTDEDKRQVIERFDLRGVVMREGNKYTIEISGIIPNTLVVSGTLGEKIKDIPYSPCILNFRFTVHGQLKAA